MRLKQLFFLFKISLQFFNSVLDTLDVQLKLVLHSNVFSDVSFETLDDLLVDLGTAGSAKGAVGHAIGTLRE